MLNLSRYHFLPELINEPKNYASESTDVFSWNLQHHENEVNFATLCHAADFTCFFNAIFLRRVPLTKFSIFFAQIYFRQNF